MYSRDHAILSLIVGSLGVWGLSLPVPWWVGLTLALVVGVGIDLDHFLIARLQTGDWTALWGVVRDPRLVVTAPDKIFERGDVWAIQRLLAHAIVGGALVGALALWHPAVAVFTALVVYAHVLSDLLWDNYRFDTYQRRHARAVRAGDH